MYGVVYGSSFTADAVTSRSRAFKVMSVTSACIFELLFVTISGFNPITHDDLESFLQCGKCSVKHLLEPLLVLY